MNSTIENNYPANLGYSMPAEWEPHKATWTSWPFDEETWSGKLEEVRSEFAQLIKTIARFEPVHLLVNDESAEIDAVSRIGENTPEEVFYHRVPLNDVWFRDNGPLFVKNKENLSFVKCEFNAWGQKYSWDKDNKAPYQVSKYLNLSFFKTPIIMEGGSIDVNGKGLALTTKQCLLNKMRNPNLKPKDLELFFKNYLNVEKVLWLDEGLEGDHTDGHIDTIVRFVKENTICYSYTDDKSDLNYLTTQNNFNLLKSYTNLQGKPFQLIPLILPKKSLFLDGKRLPATYANFYIGNDFVVVPQYNDEHDNIALNTISALFPTRKVIGLSSLALITGGGSFHCVTQQQPTAPKI